MLNAIVTEIPATLEPVTEDYFAYVVVSERPRESTSHRLADLFGDGPGSRTIVD